MKKLWLVTAISIILTACGGDNPAVKSAQAETDSNLPAVTAKTVYRVAAELDAPFIMQGERGIVGFDHDLLQAIAEKQGFEVQFTPHPWASLFDAVSSGQADLTAGGIYVTPERSAQFDFSVPYLDTGTAYFMSKEQNIKALNDVSGQKVAVKMRTVAEKTISPLVKKEHLSKNDTLWLAVKSVLNQQNNVVVGDYASLAYFAKSHPNFKVVRDDALPTEVYAFMVRRGQPELIDKLNKGLAQVRADGTYDRLYQKWFVEGTAIE